MQSERSPAGIGPRFRKWVLAVTSFVLALLAVEGGLRLVWTNPYRHEGPDRVVTLRLQHTHTHHRFNREAIHPEAPQGVLRSDARSYILPSFQHPNPDWTIAFLGGSTTECCAVDEALRFPALVSTLLEERGLKVNTLNAGTSGNTLHDSINNLLNHVIQDQPDMVVLMHACNDIGVLGATGSCAPRSGKLATWSDIVRMTLMRVSGYSSTLGLVRNVTRERFFYEPTDPKTVEKVAWNQASSQVADQFEKRLRVFTRICQAMDIRPVLMTQPLSEHRSPLTPDWANASLQARFNDLTRQVGREENVQVIDLVRHLEEAVPEWDKHMNLFYDGMHVNDRGSRVYAEQIAAELLPPVQEQLAQRRARAHGEQLAIRPERLSKH